jgi:CheY-like chemotaxis protein
MGEILKPAGRDLLIVDDEAFVRHDMVDFFEDAGFTVFEAQDADEAIDLLRRHSSIGIVLTDVQMPGSMDGLKLAHYIRDRYPPALLIVASGARELTATDLPDQAMFVPKPFSPHAVLNEIRQRL